MTWKETETIERPAPDGVHVARLEPLDSVTWGPAKAEWTYTVYRLSLDGRCLQGHFAHDLVWAEGAPLLASVRCTNFAPGEGHWSHVAADWRPREELVVIDLGRAAIGRAAFDPAYFYRPKGFEADVVVYDKRKHTVLGPVREVEVAVSAIADWQPFARA